MDWEGHCDSSLLNALGGKGSFGGCVLFFASGGGGSFHTSVTVPRKLTDSSGGAELVQATLALKTILGYRILARELRLSPTGPTRLHMDANAVIMGTKREKVSKEMRYVACRYAMLRQAAENGDITLTKVDTKDNRADMCTKPLIGKDFVRHRAAILGLPAASTEATPGL